MKFAALMDSSFHGRLFYSKCKVVRIENRVQDGRIMGKVRKKKKKKQTSPKRVGWIPFECWECTVCCLLPALSSDWAVTSLLLQILPASWLIKSCLFELNVAGLSKSLLPPDKNRRGANQPNTANQAMLFDTILSTMEFLSKFELILS